MQSTNNTTDATISNQSNIGASKSALQSAVEEALKIAKEEEAHIQRLASVALGLQSKKFAAKMNHLKALTEVGF